MGGELTGIGNYAEQDRRSIDKTLIKQRLAWITGVRSTANPARGLLNGVNTVLMGRED